MIRALTSERTGACQHITLGLHHQPTGAGNVHLINVNKLSIFLVVLVRHRPAGTKFQFQNHFHAPKWQIFLKAADEDIWD